MVTKVVRKLIDHYLTLTLWYMVHQDNEDIDQKQFEVVLKEVGQVEEGLKNNGVPQSAIDKLLNYAEKLYRTPLDQLPENTKFRICKIIFGSKTNWADDKVEDKPEKWNT